MCEKSGDDDSWAVVGNFIFLSIGLLCHVGLADVDPKLLAFPAGRLIGRKPPFEIELTRTEGRKSEGNPGRVGL